MPAGASQTRNMPDRPCLAIAAMPVAPVSFRAEQERGRGIVLPVLSTGAVLAVFDQVINHVRVGER